MVDRSATSFSSKRNCVQRLAFVTRLVEEFDGRAEETSTEQVSIVRLVAKSFDEKLSIITIKIYDNKLTKQNQLQCSNMI